MKTNIDPMTLAGMTSAQAAEAALRALGCAESPGHMRLWLVPRGKIRAAKIIARVNNYPAAFAHGGAR